MTDGVLSRLKERKLVQWALAYLAGAWLVLQVLGELRDDFGWSPVWGQLLPGFLVSASWERRGIAPTRGQRRLISS